MKKLPVLKKLVLGVSIAAMSMGSIGSAAFAETTVTSVTLSSAKTKAEIAKMSNSDFDAFLVNYIAEAKKKNKSDEEIKSSLKKLDVEYIPSTGLQTFAGGYPSDMPLTVSVSKRGTESFYRLLASLSSVNTLSNCGSLDLLSLEWDKSKATYYSYTDEDNAGKNFASLMDYSSRSEGVMLFNIEDTRMYSGDSTYVSVYVVPTSAGLGQWIDFGAKYIHSYDDNGVTWKIGGNVTYSKTTGPSGGLTFELSPTSTSKTWQSAAVNSFKSY